MRTIILQEVLTPSGNSSYWAINENGSIIDGLDAGELLWAVACALKNSIDPSSIVPFPGGKTVETMKLEAFREGALLGIGGAYSAIEVRGRAELVMNDGPAHFYLEKE